MHRSILILVFSALSSLTVSAQEAPPATQAATPPATGATAGPDLATQAVAAQAMSPDPRSPMNDFVEHMVDNALEVFDVRASSNTTTHYVIAAVFLVVAILLRRVVTLIVFSQLKRLASRTRTTLDDKLFVRLETPCATFIVLLGLFAALDVLKLSPQTDQALSYGATVAFSLVIFWCLLRAVSVALDHGHQIATARGMSIAAFMPWIKKAVIAIFVVIGVLMILQSLNFDVKAILAGLGIGGLAFALAAQDTLANLFGSVVVAIDQPFKLGDYVKIGAFEGTVEDIGLRSTRLRPLLGNLVVLPNKMVAAEGITNNSRFARRRIDQVIGLTYDTSAEKMEKVVAEIRGIIEGDVEVDKESVHVYFRDYNASSLDIWIAYNTKDPDFPKHMRLRQRINLAIMRTVESHGLSFAFPTQTVHLEGDVARQMASRPGDERNSSESSDR